MDVVRESRLGKRSCVLTTLLREVPKLKGLKRGQQYAPKPCTRPALVISYFSLNSPLACLGTVIEDTREALQHSWGKR